MKSLDFALDPNSIPIYLFEYLFSTYYVPGTVLGPLHICCVFILLELYTADTLFTDRLADKGQSPNVLSDLTPQPMFFNSLPHVYGNRLKPRMVMELPYPQSKFLSIGLEIDS